MLKRPPIVVIMGHVDHGKTTLLDFIRKSNTASREAGGITQSIGAYEIVHNNNKITFVDTPGHEAFSAMRSHGAKVADLAVLVVAADDGVKPQTKNALKYILEEKIPFVVAINKIDKMNADLEKVKNDLMQSEVFLEGYGGNISWHEISAKTGEGINELIDLILLATEMEELKYDPNAQATGIILSSRLDPRRGILVNAILKNGTLETGQIITTGTAKGKIKILENFEGRQIKNLEPSAPVLISGFEKLPQTGEEFFADKNEKNINIKIPAEKIKTKAPQTEENEKNIKIILKADEVGSLAALKQIIQKMPISNQLIIVESSIGNIYETDIKLASSTNSLIIAFKIKVDKAALNMAMAKKIMIINSPIIYELEKELLEYNKKISAQDVRMIEILGVFGTPKGKEKVVGGKILFGPIKNQEHFEIWQDKKMIGTGKILNLQSQKKDVSQAETNDETGMLVESDSPIKIRNKLIFTNQI